MASIQAREFASMVAIPPRATFNFRCRNLVGGERYGEKALGPELSESIRKHNFLLLRSCQAFEAMHVLNRPPLMFMKAVAQ